MREQRGAHQPRRPALREVLPWVPPALGVCVLIVLLVIAATRFTSSPSARAVPGAATFLPVPSQSAVAAPPATASARPSPTRSPDRTVRPATAATPGRPSRTVERATTPPTGKPAATVTGRYRVVDSYGDGFIGEVLITGTGPRDADWLVRLRFPDRVGDLVTSWVESAPQATASRSGDEWVWRSGVPVTAGSPVALRFHFARRGTGDLPDACTVNGLTCAGAR